MIFVLLCLGLVEPSAGPFSPGSPIAWSPDGRWLAYLQEVRTPYPIPAPGWLFGESSGVARAGGRTSYRIWATKVETGESLKLAESADPLSSPCWHPDGISIAYEQVVSAAPGGPRIEVVVQDGPENRRTVGSRPFAGLDRGASIARVAPAWSLDGRQLAVPDPDGPSIAIVRVADGSTVKTIEGGFGPTWSDDGKLAFFRKGTPDGVFWMDAHLSSPRRLADAPEADRGPAPFWSRDARSLSFVRRGPAQKRGLGVTLPPTAPVEPMVQLVRVKLENGQVESSDALLHDPAPSMAAIRGVSVALGRDSGEIYSAMEIRDVPHQILTLRPRLPEIEIHNRSNPVDLTIQLGAVSASPAARRIAFRVGPPGPGGLPGISDPDGSAFVPVAADEAARIEWVAALVDASRKLLDAVRSPADRQARRPTLAPVPGALGPEEGISTRTRRLAEIGRPLCDRPITPEADRATAAFLAESRLFFDLLLSDYPAALADFPSVSGSATNPDARARWLGLRAQIAVGLGDLDAAWAILDYLRSTTPGEPSRIEETPAGAVLTPLPGHSAWIENLAGALPERPSRGKLGPGHPAPISRTSRPVPRAPRPEQDLPILPEPIPIEPPQGRALPF